jgi:hypothetical protein
MCRGRCSTCVRRWSWVVDQSLRKREKRGVSVWMSLQQPNSVRDSLLDMNIGGGCVKRAVQHGRLT